MQIVYMEDSDFDINLIRRYVNTLEDSAIVCTKTVEDTLAQLQAIRPDIFLADVMINGEAAYEVIKRAIDENLARHVILLTARALPAEVQYYRTLGCKHIITKPFTVDDLDRVFLEIA